MSSIFFCSVLSLNDCTLIIDISFLFEESFHFLILILLDVGDELFIVGLLLLFGEFCLFLKVLILFVQSHLIFFGKLHDNYDISA